MRYDLVIFDNDGVLVDSEPLSNAILAGYLTELGHPTTYEDSLRDYMGALCTASTTPSSNGPVGGCPTTSTPPSTPVSSPPSSATSPPSPE